MYVPASWIFLQKTSKEVLNIFGFYGILFLVKERGNLQERTLFGKAGMKAVFKTSLKVLGKVIVSGIFALVILTLICHYFYYEYPMRRANSDGSTDTKSIANAYYSYGIEGYGLGKMNNDGFTNLFNYDDGMTIDVLIMGSSQMEALMVDMHQSTASQLNVLFENETVYNIGVASHDFLICANNLSAALEKYQPTKYVIVETGSVSFSDDAIALTIRGETPELNAEMNWGGIINLFRKSAYLRLIYFQMQNYARSQARNIEGTENTGNISESNVTLSKNVLVESGTTISGNLMADLLHKMSESAKEYGVKLIIAYHPSISITSDGTLNLNADQDAITQFKQSCDTNGILFLDMSSRFKEEYESTYILPYGFPNTPVGRGHLNKYGHAMMADELYKLILEDKQ